MRTLAKLAMGLVVLGACLPTYGEILIFRYTVKHTYFEQQAGGQWEAGSETWKGYMIIDLDYDDFAIAEAEIITYGRDSGGKWFEQEPLEDLELVRVPQGNKVKWIVMAKEVEFDEVEEEITGGAFHMLAGEARNKNIGVAGDREVPTRLSGYGLWDGSEDEGRDIGMSTIALALYSQWTSWANDDDIGMQDFATTRELIKEYLIEKGYTED